ncbi:hypothetical protein, partial [Roseovarius sp. A46]|uniref:hypothetical protein n=1 Tax=Roseovarius sp. A46 TaxID=2109331 RepID=UPI0019D6CAC9
PSSSSHHAGWERRAVSASAGLLWRTPQTYQIRQKVAGFSDVPLVEMNVPLLSAFTQNLVTRLISQQQCGHLQLSKSPMKNFARE